MADEDKKGTQVKEEKKSTNGRVKSQDPDFMEPTKQENADSTTTTTANDPDFMEPSKAPGDFDGTKSAADPGEGFASQSKRNNDQTPGQTTVHDYDNAAGQGDQSKPKNDGGGSQVAGIGGISWEWIIWGAIIVIGLWLIFRVI